MSTKKQDTYTGAYKFNYICYSAIFLFFLCLFAFCKVGLYGDSDQFISMHMHREPLYPLFLWVFRSIFGEDKYLPVVSIVQNVLNAYASICLVRFFVSLFGKKKWQTALCSVLVLLPHIMTPLFSEARIVLTSAVMNEAIALPMFYFYILCLIAYVYDGKKSHMISSAVFAFLLSMTRGSMMICLIAWGIVVTGRFLFEKKKWFLLPIPFLVMGCLFPIRGELYKQYNCVVNDVAIANMCGNMNLVTNIFYASDREAGEKIEDETTRELFYEIYDKAYADGLNYRFGGTGIYERIRHLEDSHDNLKFNYILQTQADYYYDHFDTDYLSRNIYQENMCKEMAHALLPTCLGRWIFQYIGLSVNGLVRSIAIVRPFTVIPVLLLGIGAFVLAIVSLIKKKNQLPALGMIVILMMIAANAFGTATVIMCISRYMIYGFAPFYICLLFLVYPFVEERRKKEKKDEL